MHASVHNVVVFIHNSINYNYNKYTLHIHSILKVHVHTYKWLLNQL